MSPDRAMVLAAGLGTRMRPLTSLLPKPALPVMNRPLAARLLDHLVAQGVKLAVINSHHMAETLEEVIRSSAPSGLDVKFSREIGILGTAGGLMKAARHFEGAPFYLVNADGLTDADLPAAASAHAASGRLATMVVRPHDPAGGYRPVGVVDEGRPTHRVSRIAGRSWGREAAKPCDFTGVHVLEPDVLEKIPPGAVCDINSDIYPWLLDQDPDSVGAWMHQGWWFEAGTPARYLDLNIELLRRAGRAAVVGPGFFIDEEARVERSVVGSGSRLACGAVVEGSVLWDDVTVGEGVALRRCIVTSGVEVPLMSLSDTIVTKGPRGDLAMRAMESP